MIAALIAKLWPVFAGAGIAILALLTGWARHKQAQTTEAQAGQQVAEAGAKVAQIEKSEAEANAEAARAGAAAAQERTNVEADTAGLDRAALDERLRRWTRD
ncbi:hypothetical protein DFLDMN_001481 [Cupriavidus sp. H19C3]|uniref:hypothetical protein n=1 Tax=Cupriavidus sp. H19C3 TaxID=3241603 RepID=UPI003BF8C86A